MTTRILLAPVGAGKTESVLTHIARTLENRPLAKVWALLATKRQEDALRQRLVDWDDEQRIFFNVEFFNFYELYQRLLDMAGQPQRELNDSARIALLRAIVAELYPELEVYHTIAHTPGFIRVVGEFIYELKQRRVYPDEFGRAAHTAKDRDLGRIYAAYQDKLVKYKLVDKEGQGWLAVDALTDDPTLSNNLTALLVDGFDQFTPVQADLLSLLADRTEDTLITLTSAAGREGTVGLRFEQALDRLRERFDESLIVRESAHSADDRHPDLRHLIDNIFLPGFDRRTSTGGVNFLETPLPVDEVGAVLRRIKRLLLNGTPPDEILVVLRDWGRYQGHFTALGRKYELPLALHYGEPLTENPVIVALLTALSLHEDDFRRRDLLDVLRSPYIATPGLDADLLEHISQQLIVTGGREAWLAAITQAAQAQISRDDEDEETEPPLLTPEAADTMRARLADFFKQIAPPGRATVQEYIAWVDALIGPDTQDDPDEADDTDEEPENHDFTLDMVARLREAPDSIISRDLLALNEFKRALRGLLNAQELLISIDNNLDRATDWETFNADMLRAINAAQINPRPNRSGRVLVTTATDARGLPHQHVFVLGMAEGLFPAQIPEDALYLDSERRRLSADGVRLQTAAERAADDGLFYELICLPRESLTLSRPTLDEGKPWLPSPLWRGALALYDDAAELVRRDRQGIGQTVPLNEVATEDEAATSVADLLNQAPDHITPETWAAYGWLRGRNAWAHISAGRALEMGRLTGPRFDHYSGRLRDADLIDLVRGKLGPGRVWSASQLNDYGVCGFRFFAKRLLKLDALEEPEEGLDAAQRGSLNHAILEQTYRQLRDDGHQIIPENQDIAVETLHTVAEKVFAEAPERFGFRETALWRQEQSVILRKLEKLIRVDFSDDSPIMKQFGEVARQPLILEAAFGMGARPATLDLGDGETLRIHGFIDRIDLLSNGGAVLVDYKTGSTKIDNQKLDGMKDGHNFQMMVYLAGAQAILAAKRDHPPAINGGTFWHISNQETSGTLKIGEEATTEAIEDAKGHISRYLALGREGDFAVHATKPQEGRCVRYCEFSRLCRMSSTNRRKV